MTPVLKTAKEEKKARIFLNYKRQVTPDEDVAMKVFKALKQQHKVFIDQIMLVGTRWVERIETEIRQADFLIVFLSETSVNSEMVRAEIELAHNLAATEEGKPVILPVRLAYREPFQYPLSAYLNPLNWALWEREEDTPILIAQLQKAIAGGRLTIQTDEDKEGLIKLNQPSSLSAPFPTAQLEMPEGTMDIESQFYIERPKDQIALETIKKQGVTITIKGPRQMGKSSLLIRIMDRAEEEGKRVAFLDFQLFDKAALTNADEFFPQFCAWLTDELELEDKVEEYWQQPLGNSQRCTRYMGRYLLRELGEPLLLAMDEVESLFDTDFRSDFFAMLRGWHNSRARKKLWKQLDLALVTSTEPYQLIENLNQSPFNVGEVLELTDFTGEQVTQLNQQHSCPFPKLAEQRLMNLVGGHPYLIRKALYLVASQRITVGTFFKQATNERGPFGDHLRYHLFRIYDKKELVKELLQVIRHHTCPDEQVFFRLRGAGLVRREGKKVLPRCQLYADYFQEHL